MSFVTGSFNPLMREMVEMQYLQTPVLIDDLANAEREGVKETTT